MRSHIFLCQPRIGLLLKRQSTYAFLNVVITCKKIFYDICSYFMIPLQLILKNQLALRFTQEAINTLKELSDWFIDEEFSYIRIYGYEGAPYILPRYVLDRLSLREIAYQTISVAIVVFFVKKSYKTMAFLPNFIRHILFSKCKS